MASGAKKMKTWKVEGNWFLQKRKLRKEIIRIINPSVGERKELKGRLGPRRKRRGEPPDKSKRERTKKTSRI